MPLHRKLFEHSTTYYTFVGGTLYYSKTLKDLLPLLGKISLCKEALECYLSYGTTIAPYTLFEGIYKLGSDESLSRDGKLSFETSLKPSATTTLKDALLCSIEQKTRGKNYALLLSGGIDSATLGFFGKKVPCYTIKYSDSSKYDESVSAKDSSKLLGLDHSEVSFSRVEFMQNLFELNALSCEPLGDPATMPLASLYKRAKSDGFDALLSGEGSDEIFLGYRQYFELFSLRRTGSLAEFNLTREWELQRRLHNNEVLFRSSGECFSDAQRAYVMNSSSSSFEYIKKYRSAYEDLCFRDERAWFSFVDLYVFQGEMVSHKLDLLSRCFDLEAITPFLDLDLAKSAISLEVNKPKEALRDLLVRSNFPLEILSRKKRGFGVPFLDYIKGELDLIKEVNSKVDLFKPQELERLLAEAKRGAFKKHAWLLYSLSLWLEHHLL